MVMCSFMISICPNIPGGMGLRKYIECSNRRPAADVGSCDAASVAAESHRPALFKDVRVKIELLAKNHLSTLNKFREILVLKKRN